MHWDALTKPQAIPLLVTAAADLALAAWLVWLNPRHRVHLVFGGMLASFGLFSFTVIFVRTAPSQQELDFWVDWWVNPAFLFLALLVYFVFLYPRKRGWMGASPLGVLVPATIFAVMAVSRLLEPTLDTQYVFSPPAGYQLGTYGLLLVQGPINIIAALFVILLLRDYAREDVPARRTAMLLVASGFSLAFLFDAFRVFMRMIPLVTPGQGVWGTIDLLLIDAALPFYGYAAAYAFWNARKSPDVVVRRGFRRFLGMLAVPILAVLLLRLLGGPALNPVSPLAMFVGGVMGLSLPLLVTYAIVRHQLFDIDVKVRWTIKQSTLAGAFIGIFFVVSESAQTFFTDTTGATYLGIAAAGMLVFAISPLQRVAERVAHAALPEARPLGDFDKAQRIALYREQVRAAWADGRLSRDERRLLNVARDRLGLSMEEAARIENEIEPG